MSQPRESKKYFFDTNTFIDIVHELEEIPDRPRERNDSTTTSVDRADIEIWQNLFGISFEEARYLIQLQREPGENKRTIPDEIIQNWP
jgi:hypothetical protein